MSQKRALGDIHIYSDNFEFVEAKKFLALKGPLKMSVVHDNMYPLWRYGHELIIKKLEVSNLKSGLLICYWEEGQFHPCVLRSVLEDNKLMVSFLKKGAHDRLIDYKFLLGRIDGPGLNLYWRIKIWWTLKKSA